MSNKLSAEQREALRQKDEVLAKGIYTPVPHDIYRTTLPELKAKYGAETARDCLSMLMYFHAYTNGQSANEAYLWAFPNVDQIVEDLGIRRNRVSKLSDILESEGLIRTRKIPWNGHRKKMYMPLYKAKVPPSVPTDT